MQWIIDLVKDWVIAQGYLTTAWIDRGDPAVYDWNRTDLDLDNAWHDLDLSGIIPEDAKAVGIKLAIRATGTEKTVTFRKDGNANTIASVGLNTQVANIITEGFILCSVGPDRKIEYKVAVSTWATISIVITGWIL